MRGEIAMLATRSHKKALETSEKIFIVRCSSSGHFSDIHNETCINCDRLQENRAQRGKHQIAVLTTL